MSSFVGIRELAGTDLLVQDEVVGVSVMLFERQLRDVVPLDLLDRLFQLVERRLDRFGLLWVGRVVSVFRITSTQAQAENSRRGALARLKAR